MKTEILDDLLSMQSKYLDLVWYARKGPKGSSYWDGIREDIAQGAYDCMAKVEEQYPDEIDELKGESGDWQHGFNSGMLAALRYVLTAACPYTDEVDGEVMNFGGLEDAKAMFPELDT